MVPEGDSLSWALSAARLGRGTSLSADREDHWGGSEDPQPRTASDRRGWQGRPKPACLYVW